MMGVLLTELVVVFLIYLYLRKCWRYWVSASHYKIGGRPATLSKVSELTKLKGRLKTRKLKAKTLTRFLTNPKNMGLLKSLILQELEVSQKMKGAKRRILSDLKYEQIKKAAETGKFNDEVMDFINSK